MPQPLHESARTLAEATTGPGDDAGVLEVEFITPGWGSSGYYSRQVLEAAAPLFAVGTHMYFDHPTATDHADRPERSVRDLAAVIVEAGTVDAGTGAVRGRVRPLTPYRDLLCDEAFAMNVGLSIRGSATDIVVGEAEGRQGPIVEGLAAIDSVDFVTRAGRGGRVLSVLESARDADPGAVVSRALARGVAEATADERREQLANTVRAVHGSEGRWVWVRDFDDTTVWFETSGEDEASRTWQQTYTIADDDQSVSLTGTATQVRPVTRYVPVSPAGQSITTQESKEDTMPQIEEARLRQLEEDAGRVPTLESERDTAVQERDAARAELIAERRVTRARSIIAAADVTFTPLEERGLLADLPATEDGSLDETAFTTSVNEAAAAAAQHRGAGTVTGFGGTTAGQSTLTESDLDAAVGAAFGRQVKEA